MKGDGPESVMRGWTWGGDGVEVPFYSKRSSAKVGAVKSKRQSEKLFAYEAIPSVASPTRIAGAHGSDHLQRACADTCAIPERR